MILSVTYNEQISRVAPSYSRGHWPEHTDVMEVSWVTQADGWLVYEMADGSIENDALINVKKYETRAK